MTLLRLSMRNVLRAKSRTAITMGSLFFGVAMSLVLSAFLLGVGESLVAETIDTRLGALQVHRAGYFAARERQPLRLSVPADEAFARRLLAVPNVAGVSPRIVFSGLLSNGSRATPAQVTAVDVKSQVLALPNAFRYIKGEPLSEKDTARAHVAIELASALQLERGATLMIQAQGVNGRENATDLELKAPMGGANPLESKRAMLVPLAYAQELLGMEGLATEWVIAVKSLSELAQTAQALRDSLGPDYEVQTWAELRPAVAEAVAAQRAVLGVISLVFLVIAVFGVANTLLMSVMERTREIGTLLALGMTRFQVGSLFVLEALVTAVGGAGLGLLVAATIVGVARHRGGFTISLGDPDSLFTIMPTLLPQAVAFAVIIATVGALLAALFPALRASRLRPVEALSTP